MAAAKKSVELVWKGESSKDKLRLKITVPPSWSDKPASKLAATVVKQLNAKQPGRRLDVADVAMRRGTGEPLPMEATMAGLADGETVAVGLSKHVDSGARPAAKPGAAKPPAPAPAVEAAPAPARVAQGRTAGPTGGTLRHESDAAAAKKQHFCALCGLASSRRCGRCKLEVFYCSGACQQADWRKHKPDCEANALEESRTKLAKTEIKCIMPGVEMECTAREDKRPTIKLTVVDKLSTRRHAFEYSDDTVVHKVKQDMRDAERPRYRFENHMGPLFAEVNGKPGRVLFDFKTLRDQHVKSGDVLHHIVHNPTLLQRTGFDTAPGTL